MELQPLQDIKKYKRILRKYRKILEKYRRISIEKEQRDIEKVQKDFDTSTTQRTEKNRKLCILLGISMTRFLLGF